MTSKDLIKNSRAVIKKKLRFDFFSWIYGSPVFKQWRNKITAGEIKELQNELSKQGIISHLEMNTRKFYLKVIRETDAKSRNGFFIQILLFLLTILTTSTTGALFLGKTAVGSWEDLSVGFSYSFAIMTILLAHEMAHYTASRIYKMQVTLPYFIPLFLPAFHPGTMGAFIRLRSSMPDKKALFDIGIAGPLAGLAASIIFLAVGFNRLPGEDGLWDYIAQIHPLDEPGGVNLLLGSNILFDFIKNYFNAGHLPMNEIYHFPFIFAGWIGLLVTALNLMPIGQLDGGHITYALFGDKARLIALLSFILLIVLNVYLISSFNSFAWILWPVLIFFFIKFRHPPTKDNSIELDLKRKVLGWLAYIIFCICFSPIPFHIL